MGRAGASEVEGCPKVKGLLVSAALLPALGGPKPNEGLTAVGGAGDGEPKANGFFSIGAGGAGALNEKGAGEDVGFSSAVLGRAVREKPEVVDEPCVPKRDFGVSVTGAGAGDTEGADGPNEKALFDGSATAGTGVGCPKENAGLDSVSAGAGATGVPKLNGAREGVASTTSDSLASGSVVLEVSTAGGGALNENGEDAAGRGAAAGGGIGVPSAGAGTSFGSAGTPNDTPVVVVVPKIEILAEGGVGPNLEFVAGAADGVPVV